MIWFSLYVSAPSWILPSLREQAQGRGPQGSQPILTPGQVVLSWVRNGSWNFFCPGIVYLKSVVKRGETFRGGSGSACSQLPGAHFPAAAALPLEWEEPSGTYWQIFLSKRFQLMMVGMCWRTSSLPVLHGIFCQNPEVLQGR